MVKHVIIWKLKDEFSDCEKADIKKGIKSSLEALMGVVPGLLDIKVITLPLLGSNGDVMLDSTFENEQALHEYASHPAHVAAADNFVRPYTATRSCMDFEI